MVEYVAIVPPPGAFVPSGSLPVAATTGLEGLKAQPDVEAILALRPQTYATSFDEKIANAARAHRVDPLLLHAVIKQESGYRHRAVSHSGARGLMQVMPATGRSLGVADPQNLFDAEVNVAAGAKLLSSLWRSFDGNLELVLAAYNAGEGAVIKYGMKVPPYRETRDYVAKVKDIYRTLASESGIAVQF
jgi:soluble lytic murein transglycosylase-like protein